MVTKEMFYDIIARCCVAMAEVDYDLAKWRESVADNPPD